MVVWCDFSKCGALQAERLDEVLEESRMLATAFSLKCCVVVIAPTLVSTKVLAGKRGENRPGFHKVEDKIVFPSCCPIVKIVFYSWTTRGANP